MTNCHANAERGEQLWLIHVPDVGRWTQARNLDEAETMARDLVAVMTDTDPADIQIELSVSLPTSVQAHLDSAGRLRDPAAQANSRAAEESRAAARELAAQGLTLRDIGRAVGISHQRVGQLLQTAPPGNTAEPRVAS